MWLQSALSFPRSSSSFSHSRKLMRYIKQYNKTAKPVRRAYADPTRRIA